MLKRISNTKCSLTKYGILSQDNMSLDKCVGKTYLLKVFILFYFIFIVVEQCGYNCVEKNAFGIQNDCTSTTSKELRTSYHCHAVSPISILLTFHPSFKILPYTFLKITHFKDFWMFDRFK